MAEQYAAVLLYLVPVLVAAVVAFIVTRPEKDDSPVDATPDAASPRVASVTRPHIPAQRTYQPLNRRANPSTAHPQPPAPTLLHAALSSHLAAVSGAAKSSTAPASASRPAIRPARLVSIRRPARIPRRPAHRCPHKP
ncbi:hypothetical protein [Dactylosporangium sp. CA-233914]|uniref:hypothetical protein n=1 Tax=Dactylosporangium sp. CA-233914 TaxID=3239934 RepID=UPI003D90A359